MAVNSRCLTTTGASWASTQGTTATTQTTNGPGALAGALGGLATGYGAVKNLSGSDDPFSLKGYFGSSTNTAPKTAFDGGGTTSWS